MSLSVKQADSLWVDFTLFNWALINATWDNNWSATFEISTSETATPAYTGSLTRSSSTGVFELRLNTDSASTSPVQSWATMPTGTYKLMTQFTNSTAKYREERHETLTIRTQGLT